MTGREATFPLDAEGDCRACGHHPLRHGLSGCHERIHDAFGDEERCDCEIERDPAGREVTTSTTSEESGRRHG